MRLVFDLETNGLLYPWQRKAVADRIHCLGAEDVDTGQTWMFVSDAAREHYPEADGTLEDGFDLLRRADQLIGHNIQGYDHRILRNLAGVLLPRTYPELFDTYLASYVLYPDMKAHDAKENKLPRNLRGYHRLECWGERLGVPKGDFGKHTDWQEPSRPMILYCLQDIRLNTKLFRHFESLNPSAYSMWLEHSFADIIRDQEERGVFFDQTVADDLIAKLQRLKADLHDRLVLSFPWKLEYLKTKIKVHPFNPGSRPQIERVLRECFDWKPEKFTPTGRAVIDETTLKDVPGEQADMIRRYLVVQKRLGQISDGKGAWLKYVHEGRIHGEVITTGTVTGRCSHSKPNLAQTPKAGKFLSDEFRQIIKPTPGLVMVGADAANLQLRCLAHYMAPFDGGEYVQVILDSDIHDRNQQAAGLPTRDQAKTFIYAFLFGAGDEKLGSIVGKGRAAGKRLRAKFLRNLPALAKLEKAVKARVKHCGYLTMLDGRRIPVRSEHRALNTLLMGAEAVLMKTATVRMPEMLRNVGLEYGVNAWQVLHVHDEFQWETYPQYAEDVSAAMLASIAGMGDRWGFRCPLEGEAKIGTCWAETH